jgi:hypothetical protein
VEWAILLSIVRKKDFGTDTLIVYDGLLRSKVFSGELFRRYREGLEEGIAAHLQKNRRKIYITGVAKHSKVLTRYRLAMALENLLTADFPAYVEVPWEMEKSAYIWQEYARGDDTIAPGGEVNKFVGGKMFFVKLAAGRATRFGRLTFSCHKWAMPKLSWAVCWQMPSMVFPSHYTRSASKKRMKMQQWWTLTLISFRTKYLMAYERY